MEYRYIKAFEIVDFATQLAASAAPMLPVTPWRARSQAENPDVRPDDTLLIVAFDKSEQIAGYIGLLPFQLPDTSTERIFWNTCWWIDPDAGAGVSLSLFSRFLKTTGNRVVFSDMTEKTAEILRRLKGYQVSSRSGVVVRFRHAYNNRIRNSRKTPPLLRMLAVTGIFSLADVFLNARRKGQMERWLKTHPAPCVVKMCGEIQDIHIQFANKHVSDALTFPSKERFRWWRDYPWLVPPDSNTRRIASRYYFSAISLQNQLFVLECNCNDTLAGFAIISNRDGVLKTHYLYFRSDMEHEFYLSLSSYMVRLPGAHTLVSFHEGFAGFFNKQSLPVVHIREATRYTAISDSLKEELGKNTRLQDGDGDYIFT